MSHDLIPFNEVEKMASAVAKSGLFGMTNPEQAMALMLLCQAEGIHPMTAVRDYNIIKGKPALKSEAMLARFQQAGGIVKWIEYTDKKVSAEFSHPQCPTPILVDWDIERAKQAKVYGKDNWINYPRQMLKARVVSEGVRAAYPASCAGVYTPEEVQDFSEPVGKPVVSMPKAVETAVSKPQEAVEAVIIPETKEDKPKEEKPFNAEFVAKSLKAIKKIIGDEAFKSVLKKCVVKKEEDVKDQATFNLISVEAWKVKQAQKKVKSA